MILSVVISAINILRGDVFLKRYAVWFSGSMVVAVLNYAFHPVLGRLLDPADFGDVQALISLITQVGVIFGAFSIVVVNITTNFEDEQKRDAIIMELQRISFIIVVIIGAVILLGITELKTFFNFSSVYPFIGLALMLPLFALTLFRSAYLQGSGRFSELSLSGVIGAGTKLIFASLFVVIGLGSLGATLGLLFASATMYLYLYTRTNKDINLSRRTSHVELSRGSIATEIKYGFLVLFATSLTTMFFTLDVLVVKHYFDPVEAGLYTGISAIAKILYFIVGPVAGVLLSSIKLKNSFHENTIILAKSLGISVFIGGSGLLLFYQFYDIVTSILIGQKYLVLSHLLPKAGLVMFLAALTNVLVFYFLALRRFSLILVANAGVAIVVLLMTRSHSSIDSILNDMLFGLVITIILLVIMYAKDYFSSRPCL